MVIGILQIPHRLLPPRTRPPSPCLAASPSPFAPTPPPPRRAALARVLAGVPGRGVRRASAGEAGGAGAGAVPWAGGAVLRARARGRGGRGPPGGDAGGGEDTWGD